MMQGFTIQRLGKIRNKWVREGLAEILSTFILSLFVYASGAQFLLSRGAASSAMGKALASGCGLTLAVYAGFNASGGCANPAITLMFCLTGKLAWKKWPWFALCQFVGAFIAAALTYGIYYDLISMYDGGVRAIDGDTGTGSIFMSFPTPGISKRSGFFDIMVGCGLLTGTVCAVIDPHNAGTPNGLIPLVFTFLLYGILMTFGLNTGAAINMSIDLSGRIFASIAGYGTEAFSRSDYWFWVPPVACICGTTVACFVYQLMVGNHLEPDWEVPDPNVTLTTKPEDTKHAYDNPGLSHSDVSIITSVSATLDTEKI